MNAVFGLWGKIKGFGWLIGAIAIAIGIAFIKGRKAAETDFELRHAQKTINDIRTRHEVNNDVAQRDTDTARRDLDKWMRD